MRTEIVMDRPFIYLIQSAAAFPYPDLPDDGNDIILLTWKDPADFPGALHSPGLSWNEGRNRLLAEALNRRRETGNDYLYYIFMDDDCELAEDRDLAAALGKRPTGNPFRTFERFLLEWEPAVGYTRYDFQHFEPGREVNTGHNIDALFNAFHRETLSLFLPYYTGFDAESWLYSQHLMNHLMSLFYNPHRLQCNLVTCRNRRRKGYVQRKKLWEIPTTFLANALKPDLKEQMNLERPNAPAPVRPEAPRKKDRDYSIRPESMAAHFRPDHPFIRYRHLEAPGGCAPRLLPAGARVAVCMSGRLKGLDLTWQSIRRQVLDRLGDCDLFMYVPEDEYSRHAALLDPTRLAIAPDRPLPEGALRNGRNVSFKTGVQAYLQQLWGLKAVNRMRKAHEAESDQRYDLIIRCRPDVRFLKPLPDIRALDLRYLYVPDFHAFDGINDRFALGRPDFMDLYLEKYDGLHAYVAGWTRALGERTRPVSAEMFTAGHLRDHGVPVRLLDVRFNRVREYGEIEDTGG